MFKECLLLLLAVSVLSGSLAAQSDASIVVSTDKEFFEAICSYKTLIWLGADLDLREEHWPQGCSAPVRLANNLTISGPLDKPIQYTISFNFMARKLVIPPNGEVRLRHFTARNTRKGGGGEIDFIAYSPKGILWTEDLNKNQIICILTDDNGLATLRALPLPVNVSEFANKSQVVEMWPNFCTYGTSGRCWTNGVLHYDQFFTDVNVGSDTVTGGYIMAKRNASKTCDDYVTPECIKTEGGNQCMMDVINAFLADLEAPPASRGEEEGSSPNKLAIALPVALGGAALVAGVFVLFVFLRRRRQRRDAAAAEARAAAAKLGPKGDIDSNGAVGGLGGGGGGAGVVSVVVHGSKSMDSNNSGSKEAISSSDDGHAHLQQLQGQGHPRGTAESFGYETNDDMGRCLSANLRGGAALPSWATSGGSSSSALVEGVMDDGSVCTFSVGTPLGQGSYGVVFKGFWRGRPVAVKLILCEKAFRDQVMNEVRLMTSEACRHPNLLRAHACMTRSRVVNKQQPAGQALQTTIATLASARSRSGPSANTARDPDAEGTELAETWIVSEYCDLGSLAPHVHVAKRFLSSGTTTATATAATAAATATVTTAAATATAGDLGDCANISGTPSGSGRGSSGGGGGVRGGEGPLALATPPPVPSRGRRPRVAAILSCLRDIAAGMTHLHSLNIVHGDLKLANVLLSSKPYTEEESPSGTTERTDGVAGQQAASGDSTLLSSASMAPLPADMVAKVADFGLSRWLKEGQTHHSTKTVGTVTHMPPELLRSGKLTLSGDVYSFGIIMWELLTGSVPYKGLMYGEVVERVVVSHRRPEFPAHTPLAYRTLAERCWAADAAARPTFAAVLSELDSMLATAATLQEESDLVDLPAQQSTGSSVSATAAANAFTGAGAWAGDGVAAGASEAYGGGATATAATATLEC